MEVVFDISEKTLKKLGTYCDFNKIEVNSYVDEAVMKRLMVDMYGNTPFSDEKSFYGEITVKEDEPTTTTSTTTKKPRVKKVTTTTTTTEKPVEIIEVPKPADYPVRKKRKL